MEIYELIETDPTEIDNDRLVCFFLYLEDAEEACENEPNYYIRSIYVYESYSEYLDDQH